MCPVLKMSGCVNPVHQLVVYTAHVFTYVCASPCAQGLLFIVFVCLLHLTSPMFVGLTNDTTYLTANEGQIVLRFSLKMLRCKARALPLLYGSSRLRKMRMRLLC